MEERIVVTGIGMVSSLGLDRETTWRNLCRGATRMRLIRDLPFVSDCGVIGATVDIDEESPGQFKTVALALRAAGEALQDAGAVWPHVDATRFGCSIAGHMGDTRGLHGLLGHGDPATAFAHPWTEYWLPNSACAHVAERYGLMGPRTAHSTACASSLISILVGVRMLRDGSCDAVLTGGAEALDPLFAAGFRRMGVLATSDDPATACRPFDRHRNGFVMGEGGAMLVLERESHARARGARIYAEVMGGQMLSEAHHVTGLNAESEALCHLIDLTLRNSGLEPADVGYINAHATATEQNDLVEMRAIRRVFGEHCRDLCVSGTKSMLGHMINAAGAVEVATTLLALRDGFAPPTINVTDIDPECAFDCVPRQGRVNRFQCALKLSVAFGGHLAAIALRRWNDPATGFAYPSDTRRAA